MLTSEEGWADLVELGETVFLEMHLLTRVGLGCRVQSHFGSLSLSGEGPPYIEPWFCGYGDWR